jgi:hypothetical protein
MRCFEATELGAFLNFAAGNGPALVTPATQMKNVQLLLASSNRNVSIQLEAMVLDVCYNQAVVHCTRTGRVDELVAFGCREGFDLILVASNNLFSPRARGAGWAGIDEVTRAVGIIHGEQSTPIIAVGAPAEHEFLLLESGARSVHGFPLNASELKPEFRRVLDVREELLLDRDEALKNRWSFSRLFSHSLFQRVKVAAD